MLAGQRRRGTVTRSGQVGSGWDLLSPTRQLGAVHDDSPSSTSADPPISLVTCTAWSGLARCDRDSLDRSSRRGLRHTWNISPLRAIGLLSCAWPDRSIATALPSTLSATSLILLLVTASIVGAHPLWRHSECALTFN